MNPDVVVIGSGMGSLAAAALLTREGLNVKILERNWIAGGCTTSYWRKGFVFEAGATTLVGLDEGMPLKYLLDKTGIQIAVRRLELPMQVHTPSRILNRRENIGDWIKEVERYGGNQKAFWKLAFEVSQFVWGASTRYLHFPPSRTTDFWKLARNFKPKDLRFVPYAFKSTAEILDQFGLTEPEFREFIDQQLMITAQNRASEVNFLFGAAALCYTNYGNYYIDGGLINLVTPFVEYIVNSGGSIQYRTEVVRVERTSSGYRVHTPKEKIECRFLVSGIPINNSIGILDFPIRKTIRKKILESTKLYSAFQMGIGFLPHRDFDSLHHQVILPDPLPILGSKSVFVSFSHPQDSSRSDEPGLRVAGISTHIFNPETTQIDKKGAEEVILNMLEEQNMIKKANIRYIHSSTQHSWEKWTGRAYGFVGGYPQFMHIKPWEMLDSRIDDGGAYHCGDTAYPGQGIPGATLSGIIAAEKLRTDWL